MKRRTLIAGTTATAFALAGRPARAATKDVVYLTPGLDLPFWRALAKGVEANARAAGYEFRALDSRNSAQTQLQNAQDAIARGVAGIVLSPTDSSTAPSVQALAKRNDIPRGDRRYRHQRRRLRIVREIGQLQRRVWRRRGDGEGAEGEGVGRRSIRAMYHFARA